MDACPPQACGFAARVRRINSSMRRQDRIRTARKTGEPSRSDHHPPVSFGFDQTTLHTAQVEPIFVFTLETSARGVGRFFIGELSVSHSFYQLEDSNRRSPRRYGLF